MSSRSIVEFNHDFVHDIKRNPEDFVGLLIQALNSGDEKEWGYLKRFGINYVTMTHHSDVRKVVTPWKEYEL